MAAWSAGSTMRASMRWSRRHSDDDANLRSRDAGAVAVGADDIALAFGQSAAQRGVTIEIVRTGSRGLYWLEPLVELATAHGRIAFGPVTTSDVPSLLDRWPATASTPCGLVSQTRFPG